MPTGPCLLIVLHIAYKGLPERAGAVPRRTRHRSGSEISNRRYLILICPTPSSQGPTQRHPLINRHAALRLDLAYAGFSLAPGVPSEFKVFKQRERRGLARASTWRHRSLLGDQFVTWRIVRYTLFQRGTGIDSNSVASTLYEVQS